MDSRYGPRPLLLALHNAAKASCFRHLVTAATYRSHGLYLSDMGPPAPRFSCIDHVYVREDLAASVLVLPDATTDQRPVLAEITVNAEELAGLETINRRKTKDLSPKVINRALENTTDWGKIHHISDLEEIYTFLMGGVNKALDIIAPTKSISVRRGVDLYLQDDTLELMKVRDAAKAGEFYRRTKNRVSALVKRDKLLSNLKKLRASGNAPPRALGGCQQRAGEVKTLPP
jgi:hypothetical protein